MWAAQGTETTASPMALESRPGRGFPFGRDGCWQEKALGFLADSTAHRDPLETLMGRVSQSSQSLKYLGATEGPSGRM